MTFGLKANPKILVALNRHRYDEGLFLDFYRFRLKEILEEKKQKHSERQLWQLSSLINSSIRNIEYMDRFYAKVNHIYIILFNVLTQEKDYSTKRSIGFVIFNCKSYLYHWSKWCGDIRILSTSLQHLFVFWSLYSLYSLICMHMHICISFIQIFNNNVTCWEKNVSG